VDLEDWQFTSLAMQGMSQTVGHAVINTPVHCHFVLIDTAKVTFALCDAEHDILPTSAVV
jgi:hypothetical protein